MSDPDAQRCPLCGAENDCLLARRGPEAVDACWCRDERFPAELLERVPAEARGRRCICRSCAREEAEARP